MSELRDLVGARAPYAPAEVEGLPVGLPMPRDRSLLTDTDRRVHATRRPGRRFPFPVPNGWFVVARSSELDPGEVRALYYFGRDVVLYRTASGEPRLVDAHCAHLGAHLAVGGRVDGDCITCPFHGWAYDGATGACVDIPYGGGTRIPSRARVRSYPTLERNQMVWAWYHEREGEPFYDVPEVPEFADPEWSPIEVREFEIAVAAQDMAENNVDYAHFKYVHGTDGIPEDEFIVDGTYKRAVGMDGNFVREGYGLGLGVLRVNGYVTFLSSTTPIDEEHVHVRWIFTSPLSVGEDAASKAADSFCEGVTQDIPIWENKVYRDRPVLTKSERPILEHRKWAEQFYCAYEEDHSFAELDEAEQSEEDA
ncbi:MAG TPA: Rieske 2Fe-2S domain-containing protein [Acidimicrobiales bacterium]|nr:Rieske 2Fe-2S domain-containing protein [Acidimicrobiales bacterium]